MSPMLGSSSGATNYFKLFNPHSFFQCQQWCAGNRYFHVLIFQIGTRHKGESGSLCKSGICKGKACCPYEDTDNTPLHQNLISPVCFVIHTYINLFMNSLKYSCSMNSYILTVYWLHGNSSLDKGRINLQYDRKKHFPCS